jgi:hypothetical protein
MDWSKIAEQAWEEVFHRNAYTNFSPINYLKAKAGISWDDLLRDPRLLSTRVTKDAIAQDTSRDNVLT